MEKKKHEKHMKKHYLKKKKNNIFKKKTLLSPEIHDLALVVLLHIDLEVG